MYRSWCYWSWYCGRFGVPVVDVLVTAIVVVAGELVVVADEVVVVVLLVTLVVVVDVVDELAVVVVPAIFEVITHKLVLLVLMTARNARY